MAVVESGSTTEVLEKHQISKENLLNWMNEHVEGFEGSGNLKQFAGGQSCPTYLLETSGRDYVIRRKPPGKLLPSAHAVDREYRVIKAVYDQGYPAPRPFGMCMDESVIGTIFFVMEKMDGTVGYEHTLPWLSPQDRKLTYDKFVDTAAQLHSYDYKAIGLEDFGRPGNYFQRQINRWTKQYQASKTQDIPSMDKLMEWLPEHTPESERECLIHGDYSTHNTIFGSTSAKVVAVLDWELSTIGDPLGDIYYMLRPWYQPGEKIQSMSDRDKEALGIPTLEQMVARYCEKANRPMITDHTFYQAYILFRLAGILQGIVGRVRDGTAADPSAGEREALIKPLADAGWDLVKNN